MTSFSITGYSSIPRSLTAAEDGVVTTSGELVSFNTHAISISNGTTTTLVINGMVATAPITFVSAIRHIGSRLDVDIGPNGFVRSFVLPAILSDVAGRFELSNLGAIVSGDDAVSVRGSDNDVDILIGNHGVIDGSESALRLDGGGARPTIVNTGTLTGQYGWGILLDTDQPSAGISLFNTGQIVGRAGAFSGGDGLDVVVNSGLMIGNLRLQGSGDIYRGTLGRVDGNVLGGAGDDTLLGGESSDMLSGGQDNDTILGHGGSDDLRGDGGPDIILGGDGNDTLDGGTENDTLNGNAGDDTLRGDADNDLLVGQDGSDLLDGGTGNDTMDGGNGDDVLEGGNGNDILRGRNGEDDLAGGAGFDLLTGGQGADSFVFRALSETAVGATRDQILDFEQGVDLIIVAGLHPGVFEFRGTSAFAPSGNPELRLFETATGSTIVQMDADGNGTADAEIRVANVTGLTAEDFVL